MPNSSPPTRPERLRVLIRGAVQGVGFRPFVYRLAGELGLAGWVGNSAEGVRIEAEGDPARLEAFLVRLPRELPPHAFIQSLEAAHLDALGLAGFEIRPSLAGEKTALVLPDIATCPDCLREMLDPADRRHRYPFINCTHCGPRYSIIEALPYDRPVTTMRRFAMCADCRGEYEDPADRRFHAQPNACPVCGPHLELWDGAGRVLATHEAALARAAGAIGQGLIVAVKGLGGFHLMVDARSEEAVGRLRRRKGREEKPFALMAGSLAQARAACEASPLEERLLLAPEAPIVLLRRRAATPEPFYPIACAVAPGSPTLGLMLPYTPLHHLLLGELGYPVVATSGNLSDEPICTDEREALGRLAGVADLFLVHDRPVARHVDDSIVRLAAGREQVVRRARGYAPLPVQLAQPLPPVLAVGAQLKNTVAIGVGRQVFVSQHIGDLETRQAMTAFEQVVGSLTGLYECQPRAVACDEHSDYLSTQFARRLGLPVVSVQHHYAHALACMAENEVEGSALAVTWDGTGLGRDGTIWGGEFLRIDERGWTRAAHLRPFGLPGGERAVREPRRSALGLLYELEGAECFANSWLMTRLGFTPAELRLMRAMLEKGLNTPRTSSAGRLFDAVAALAGLRRESHFEGQAAMELEYAMNGAPGEVREAFYPFALVAPPIETPEGALVVDWSPLASRLIHDLYVGLEVAAIARKFHNTLVEMMVGVARRVGEAKVVLAGGCFQNQYLLERAVGRLRQAGFEPYWPQRIPPNDGGIALGQAVAAQRQWQGEEGGGADVFGRAGTDQEH